MDSGARGGASSSRSDKSETCWGEDKGRSFTPQTKGPGESRALSVETGDTGLSPVYWTLTGETPVPRYARSFST